MTKRFAAVVVLYAIVILTLAMSDAIAPNLGWYVFWLESWPLKILMFFALWLAVPYILPKLSGKKDGEPPPPVENG